NPPRNIDMFYRTDNPNANLTQIDQTLVYNYNQVSGQNFQVFYNEQRPDFHLPPSGFQNSNLGCPEGNPNDSSTWLTNQDCFTRDGVALGGEIARGLDTTTHPEIHGITTPIAASSGNNQAPVVNAGPDLTTAVNAQTNLRGSATDDGLPGQMTFA